MKDFIGELAGTFILVFFGCGSVAVSTLFSSYNGLFQIAAIWGIGVTLAIYASRGLSCAHLNPAVSIAFVVAGRMSPKRLPVYLSAQFLAAFFAATTLYFLFGGAIAYFETTHHIVRGSLESVSTAKMFGEYFFRSEGGGVLIPIGVAFLAEAFGAFLLMTFIFALTEGCNVGRPHEQLAPVFIGSAITALICIIAPLTQAGFNPARDFGPRLFAYFAGWGKVAIPGPDNGFFVVYILAPIVGGITASLFFRGVIQPLMESGKKNASDCR
ncbi:MAG: aquaporin [Candidatus Omnitrophica bacterium CG_4_10_14_0_8_um_filter_44_12]|nr:MAG: aquaporin [Candidatus Omnitrophica bacterium CG_4_10_14_0_8_um_filter_44_12]